MVAMEIGALRQRKVFEILQVLGIPVVWDPPAGIYYNPPDGLGEEFEPLLDAVQDLVVIRYPDSGEDMVETLTCAPNGWDESAS